MLSTINRTLTLTVDNHVQKCYGAASCDVSTGKWSTVPLKANPSITAISKPETTSERKRVDWIVG
eukprot:1374924-Amorphochlora_amoeboformis.AAC.1